MDSIAARRPGVHEALPTRRFRLSQTHPFPERVPSNAVERLLEQFTGLQNAVQAAAELSLDQPVANSRWSKALLLLDAEQDRLTREADAFRLQQPDELLKHAAELRDLARRMDGYGAGLDDAEQKVILARQLVVLTAWQICAAASGSEAAGL